MRLQKGDRVFILPLDIVEKLYDCVIPEDGYYRVDDIIVLSDMLAMSGEYAMVSKVAYYNNEPTAILTTGNKEEDYKRSAVVLGWSWPAIMLRKPEDITVEERALLVQRELSGESR